MEQATQVFAAVSLLVIGLSHLVQPKAWVAFFQALAAQGPSGAFTEGFLCLSFGGVIVAFHNVWQGPALLLTLLGWAQILKGLGRFVAPQVARGCRLCTRCGILRGALPASGHPLERDRLAHVPPADLAQHAVVSR